MTEFNVASEPGQSTGEEIANSISHGIGLLVAIAAGPFVDARAWKMENHGVSSAQASLWLPPRLSI